MEPDLSKIYYTKEEIFKTPDESFFYLGNADGYWDWQKSSKVKVLEVLGKYWTKAKEA